MRNFGKSSTGIIFTAKFQLCEPLEQPQTSRFVKKVGDKSKS